MTAASLYQRPSQSSARKELWLCLRFSSLAMNCFDIRHTDPIIVAITHQQHIWQTTDKAQQSGICNGQSVTHALMLRSDLELIERDPHKETNKLEALSDWAYRFSSHVHIYDDHTLLLEIGRSLTLFKGLQHLRHLICHDLNIIGIDAQTGLAHTPKAAHLLSFSGQDDWQLDSIKQRLAQALLDHLAIDHSIIEKLKHCGFQCLGDILSVPTAQLGERFGRDFTIYLAKLQGRLADPQVIATPAETFSRKIDFAEPIKNRTWIKQQVDRLLNDLVNFVTIRNVLCRSFIWRFYAENNHLLNNITVHLSSSKTDFDTFRSLTDLQFERTLMPSAFSSIELYSEDFLQRHSFQNDLINAKVDHEGMNQLLEKLSNRLGNGALFTVSAQAEHLPELACQRDLIKPACSSPFKDKKKNTKDEPLWLLEHPQKLRQNDSKPIYDGVLRFVHGPHRISSHWWTRLQSRDYYIARQKNGRLLWIYYERSQRNWYLHGLFG